MTVMLSEIPMILSKYQYMYLHGLRVSVESILQVCSFSNAICFEKVHSFRSEQYLLPNKYVNMLLFLS